MSLLEDINKEVAGVSLLEELNNAPEESGEFTESEQWRPEPGEGIEGVVTETYSFKGKFKDAEGNLPTIPGWVLKVDGDNDVLWSVAGLHGVLRQEMEKADAQVGDRVAVLYSGKRKTKDGEGEYNHYRLAIRRGNGAPPATAPAQRSSAPEAAAKAEPAAKPRRKPGQAKAADEGDPPF